MSTSRGNSALLMYNKLHNMILEFSKLIQNAFRLLQIEVASNLNVLQRINEMSHSIELDSSS